MKTNLHLTLLVFFLSTTVILAQKLQSPSEFLGYTLGSEFTRHHRVVDYFKHVDEVSKNVLLQQYGLTNEGRSLNLAYIASEENMAKLDEIRQENLKKTGIIEGSSDQEIAIVWLSYNVHGNESCSTEAAMLTIYKLLTERKDLLENTVIIMDPCINPDGRDRYVNWYNQYRSRPHNTNPETTEHMEPWPGGRRNHYLFDLNRDWFWVTQVESQQRLKVYNQWLPHVHVDFHEQGVNSPYYFAPAAKPYHEVITDWQVEFQTAIGKNNAAYFDKNGWPYFTKESFDLLYPSYGDTYPTYMGGIGMTYEQGGSGRAGLGIINNVNAELSLYDRLIHHTTSGLATVETASKNAKRLNTEFEKYFDNSNLKYKSYVLRGTAEKIRQVEELLQKHEIVMQPAVSKSAKVYDYESKTDRNIRITSSDWIVQTDQPKGKMVKVLFEPETKLADSASYDITAWSIPHVYGLKGFASTTKLEGTNTPNRQVSGTVKNEVPKRAYAFVMSWKSVADAELLGDLLEEGFYVRYASKAFSVDGQQFDRGSLIVMRGENKKIKDFEERVSEVANRLDKKVYAVQTGFVDSGYDFGSNNVRLITTKKIAVLSGKGTSSGSFGSIWHFFETQLNYPLHVLNVEYLNRLDLSGYETIIIPDGFSANKAAQEQLKEYVTSGGNLVVIGSSMNNFAGKEGFKLKKKFADEDDEKENQADLTAHDMRRRSRLSNSINGSIYKSKVDNTHPMAYGYGTNYHTLKNGAAAYDLLPSGNVAYFPAGAKVVSGFSGIEAQKLIPNSLLFGVEQKGRGQLVYMVDDPLFRSFWENGKLFFVNALFMN